MRTILIPLHWLIAWHQRRLTNRSRSQLDDYVLLRLVCWRGRLQDKFAIRGDAVPEMSAWQIRERPSRAAAEGYAVAAWWGLPFMSKKNELLPSRHPRDQGAINADWGHVQSPRFPGSCRQNAELRGLAGQKSDGVLTIRG